MMIESVRFFRCRCGVLVAGGEKKFTEKIKFPLHPDEVNYESLLPKDLYDEIQVGLWDKFESLASFKGLSYSESIAKLRERYIRQYEKVIERLRSEADSKEKEYKKKAKSVTRKEDKSGIVLEWEGWEPIVEQDENKGIVKCPKCKYILISWAK